MKNYIILLFMLLGIGQQALAITNVSGILTGVNTFAKANGPYVVNANLLVYEGATLMIEPGTEVRVDPGVSFFVEGSLSAIGTATDPIVFKSNVANPTWKSWKGIEFRNVGAADSGIFDHCQFTSAEYAVYVSFGISAPAGGFSVTNCTVTGCDWGFKLNGTSSIVSNNVIKHCRTGMEAGPISIVSANEVAHAQDQAISTWGDVSVTGNYAHDCGSGIYSTGTFAPGYVQITNNKVVNSYNNAYVIHNTMAGSSVHHNLSVYSGDIGYYLADVDGDVEHNTSIYDNRAVRIEEAQSLVFKNNCISNSTTYFVKLMGTYDVDISGNYWGTTDTNILNAMMIDYYDDFISPKGQILPVLTMADGGCQSYTGPAVTSVAHAKPVSVAVTVSPNPFAGSFTIDLQGRATQLSVFNMAGQRVYSAAVSGRSKAEVDMSVYAAGVYYYHVTLDDHTTATGKLVKQ